MKSTAVCWMQVTWKDCLANGAAWDTLTWFAALIGMASYLNKYGFIKWFSNQVCCRPSPHFCHTPHHCLLSVFFRQSYGFKFLVQASGWL